MHFHVKAGLDPSLYTTNNTMQYIMSIREEKQEQTWFLTPIDLVSNMHVWEMIEYRDKENYNIRGESPKTV